MVAYVKALVEVVVAVAESLEVDGSMIVYLSDFLVMLTEYLYDLLMQLESEGEIRLLTVNNPCRKFSEHSVLSSSVNLAENSLSFSIFVRLWLVISMNIELFEVDSGTTLSCLQETQVYRTRYSEALRRLLGYLLALREYSNLLFRDTRDL